MKPENKAKVLAMKAARDAAKIEWDAMDKGISTAAGLKKRIEAIEKLLGLSK